jgi:hypothetical protein
MGLEPGWPCCGETWLLAFPGSEVGLAGQPLHARDLKGRRVFTFQPHSSIIQLFRENTCIIEHVTCFFYPPMECQEQLNRRSVAL